MTDLPTGTPVGGPVPDPPAPTPSSPGGELAGDGGSLGAEGRTPAGNGGAPGDRAAPPTATGAGGEESAESAAARRRRRGSRGGRNRSRSRAETEDGSASEAGAETAGSEDNPVAGAPASPARAGDGTARLGRPASDIEPELPDRHREGKPSSVEAADRALVRKPPAKPKIGDSMPAPAGSPPIGDEGGESGTKRKRRRGGRGRGSGAGGNGQDEGQAQTAPKPAGGRGRGGGQPIEAVLPTGGVDLGDDVLEARRGRERKGRPVGRYLMAVHHNEKATQIAVLEGRNLIEHFVSKPSDDVSQIHGNIYVGKVQNVLPGMEAAFIDISTPKNAVLYRGDVHYDQEDIEGGASKDGGKNLRIEQMLKAKQTIICQVTKNPIGAKGARLTQEVSLPGRFVVLIPNSTTYGISKRLSDDERKRLRNILDKVKPKQHGVIVRTAAEGVTDQEIEQDVRRLVDQWNQIDALARKTQQPSLLYREPDMAVRVIREEFNNDYRGVVIDDRGLYESVRDYVASISPELADRVEYFDPDAEQLPLYEQLHIHEQLHKALDRKVWLPSGGSLIIEHTEALTVIDVNTGKNVGTSNLEETVFRNNMEAATEIARQLRLRDVGGIIVVDFIDMEIKPNRDQVIRVFKDALARDKTRTQVFEISELGLCEMTRKRIGEGLLESFAGRCPTCEGRGVVLDADLLPSD
ncbi:MAG: Rne/Rng family ribonuclease [Acidimicrobiales bacterium]